jgi:hypothetical protein
MDMDQLMVRAGGIGDICETGATALDVVSQLKSADISRIK